MFLSFILFFASLLPIHAADEFSSSQKINYYFDQNGNATVRHEYELTNQLSQIYPEKYLIKLPFDDLENIVGQDNIGNAIGDIQTKNGHTSITFKFNRPSIGKDQVTKFKLSYRQKTLAKRKGNTWEIQLPQQNDYNSKEKIAISIGLPSSF